jgi:hypothetical protein
LRFHHCSSRLISTAKILAWVLYIAEEKTAIVTQRLVSFMGIDLNADSGKLAFPPTIDSLKNLALRFIKAICGAKRRNIAARQEPIAVCSGDFRELRFQRRRVGAAQRYVLQIFVLHENMRIMNT